MKRIKTGKSYTRVLALVVALIMMFCEVAFADMQIQTQNEAIEGDSITVVVTGAKENERITILVYDVSVTRDNITDEEILYVNQKKSDTDGKSTFTFPLPGEAENIRTVAVGNETSEVLTQNITITKGTHTITFVNYDGETVLSTIEVSDGTTPEYNGQTPMHPDQNGYRYSFNNTWSPEIMAASGPQTYIAQYSKTAIEYTITYENTKDASISESDKKYTVENAVTLPVLEKGGFTFGGWYTNEACTEGKTTKIETGTTGDKIFYAKWMINEYTVTFDSNGGSTVANATVEHGETVTEPSAPTREGYHFAGWQLGSEAYDFTMPVTGDIKLIAQWTINSYAISVDTPTAEKGTITVTDESEHTIEASDGKWTLNYGTKFKVTIIGTGENVFTPDSITVTGLTADNGVYTMPANNVTISAGFTKKQYTVTKPDTIANGAIEINGLVEGKAKAGDTFTVQAVPEDATYKLASLTVSYTNAEGEQSRDITTEKSFTVPGGVTGDITVTPIFVRKAVDRIEITPASTNIKQNTSGDFAAKIYASAADDNSDLTDVYNDSLVWSIEIENGGTQESGTDISVGSDKSKATLSVDSAQAKDNNITVKATTGTKTGTATVIVTDEDVYAVNISEELQPYISVDKGSAAEGAEVTITVAEKNGYRIEAGTLKVTKSGNAEVEVTDGKFTMPAEAVTISAEVEAIDYTLTIQTNTSEGTVTANNTTYNVGDKVVLTVTPNDGYCVATVIYTEAGEGKTPQIIAKKTEGADNGKYVIDSMPAADITISVVFEKESYVLTNGKADTNTETNGGGYLLLSPAAGNVLYDEDVTVTVRPNTGYELATLSVGGTDVTSSVTEGTYTFKMPASATEVTATFRARSFALTKRVAIDGSYEITGITFGADDTASVTYGTVLTISATPSTGYEVDTVTVTKTGDENIKPTLNNNSFTMPDYPVTVSVIFRKINYTINTSAQNGTIIFTGDKTTANKDDVITFTVNAAASYELKANSVKVNGGDVPIAENDGFYSFTMPAENVTISAEFDEIVPVVKTVTVTFNAGEGSFGIDEQTQHPKKTTTVTIDKGSNLTANDLPAVTAPEGYTFNGWGNIIENAINADTSFTAEYTVKSYTITWLDEDGETLDTSQVDYGIIPIYPGETPTKADTEEYTYTFKEWMPAPVRATENTSYRATFIPVRKDAQKTYLSLLNTFKSILQIEKTVGQENSVVLTASALEDNTLPVLNLYVAIYNEDHSLKSVRIVPFAVANDDYKAALTKPEVENGERFKIMLWTDRYEPVIDIIDNANEEFFK